MNIATYTRGEPIRAVGHVVVPVGDMAYAERFYVGVLGAELRERFDTAPRPVRNSRRSVPLSVRLGGETGTDIFLRRAIPGLERTQSVIGVVVGSALLYPLRARLVSARVPVDTALSLSFPSAAAIYFVDPFGNKLEVSATAHPRRAEATAPDWAALAYDWRG